MHIDVVEAGTPEVAAWADRWFDPWFSAVDEGEAEGRVDPVRERAPEVLASLHRRMETYRKLVLSVVDDEGTVAGGAIVHLPQLDNKDLTQVGLYVAPRARRRGHGTALLGAVRDLTLAEGRTSVLAELDRPFARPPEEWPGTAFAQARGFTLRLASVRRDLPLPVPMDRWRSLHAEALTQSGGYRVETWTGRTREQDRDRMAALMARMTTDAPMGDLEYEPEAWDAARVADFDDYHLALDRTWWTAVAVAPDGTWAGFSQLGWTPHEPDRLYQWDTLVLKEHRGRRLGLLLKLATLGLASRQAPDATRVTTWNAASNEPMIGVNEAMGFRAVESGEEWQADVGELRLG